MKLKDLLKAVPDQQHELLEKAYQHAQELYHANDTLLEQGLLMAGTLTELQLQQVPTLAGAILHAVPALPCYQHQKLETAVSKEVAELVQQIQQNWSLLKQPQPDNQADAYHLRKSILLGIKDLRVILIMLAEQFYLLSNTNKSSLPTIKKLAQNCRLIYIPIAHALGIDTLKNKLEDLSFFIIDPLGYKKLQKQSQSLLQLSEKMLEQVQVKLGELLKTHQIKAEIFGRVKSLYSISQKIQNRNISPQKLHDLIAIRILVANENTCYQVLKIVHQHFQQVPARFKDYISLPKQNGYQSLHTTIVNQKQLLEIQTRTKYMHRWAEFGIAAHYSYKEPLAQDIEELDSIKWFRYMAKQANKITQ